VIVSTAGKIDVMRDMSLVPSSLFYFVTSPKFSNYNCELTVYRHRWPIVSVA